MNIKRIASCAVLGAMAMTAFSWGGLYFFGAFVLQGNGSLFDSNPSAANLFFSAWLAITVVGAVIGGYLGHVSSKKK